MEKFPLGVKSPGSDGLLLKIHNTLPVRGRGRGQGQGQGQSNIETDTEQERRIRFRSAAFDSSCEKLAYSDHRGNLFVLDLLDFNYWTVELSNSTRALCFLTNKPDCLIVTLNKSPFHLLVIHIKTFQVLRRLQGHKARARQGSCSASLRYILTSSLNEAIVWESKEYTKYYVLDTQNDIERIEFAPISDNIVAAYRNSTIQMWKRETYEPLGMEFKDVTSFAFTVNGRAMVLSSRSDLRIVDTETMSEKNIELKDKITDITYIQFLPEKFDGGSNKMLLILADDVIYFYNMERFIIQYVLFCEKSSIRKLLPSHNGKYIACILQHGEINIYKASLLKNKYISNAKKPHSSSKNINIDTGISNEIDEIMSDLNMKSLKRILLYYNEYPQKYRNTIWKILLNTPRNRTAYIGLSDRKIHPIFENISHSILLKHNFYVEHLKALLSCLVYWCPVLGYSKILRSFVFPFLKMFHKEPLFCFEAVATVLINYCQNWFIYAPLPPVNILAIIENILTKTDPELLRHFTKHNVTSDIYAWKLLKTAFSEVLLSTEWMVLWDHVLSNESSFLLVAVVAYNIFYRNTLLNICNDHDFKEFFVSQNPINMIFLIKKCYKLWNELPKEIHPQQFFEPIKYLDKGDCYTQYHIGSINFQIS